MNYEVERIKELCQERGWSQYRLAKEMGEPNGRINTLLKGKSVPNNATLRRVCAAFNITLSTFYQTDGALVTLTEDQHKMLKDYSRLDSYCRSLASAYIQGLAEASVREKDKPRE